MRRQLRAMALACAASFLMGAQALAESIQLTLDTTAPLRLSAPAEGIAIGNPSVIGVTMQNDRLLFVTGLAYGTTNLIIVGAESRVIYSGRVTVTPDESGSVMVVRGLETSRLECTPLCRPRPDIGDASSAFSEASSQASSRASQARGR